MNNKVSAVQAAKELNMGVLTLYGLMREGKLDIGYAVLLPGKSKWAYHIYREPLDRLKAKLGITQKEE